MVRGGYGGRDCIEDEGRGVVVLNDLPTAGLLHKRGFGAFAPAAAAAPATDDDDRRPAAVRSDEEVVEATMEELEVLIEL